MPLGMSGATGINGNARSTYYLSALTAYTALFAIDQCSQHTRQHIGGVCLRPRGCYRAMPSLCDARY
eukprot:1383143-Rhodomonas_salina.2